MGRNGRGRKGVREVEGRTGKGRGREGMGESVEESVESRRWAVDGGVEGGEKEDGGAGGRENEGNGKKCVREERGINEGV